MIYFDNAASSYPKPSSVSATVKTWLVKNGANPGRSGHTSAIEASELIYDTRCLIAKLFGVTEPDNIAFVPNATYGINFLLQGLLKPGDHVVTTDFEHNSVLRPIYKLSGKGVSYSIAEVDFYDDTKTVENILKLVKSNTRLVACTQCSNVCGKVLPVSELRKKLPRRVSLLVDGSQGAGVIPTNLETLGIDYYCAPSHKALLGPQGCGFVAVLGKLPDPLIVGGTGSESFDKNQPSFMPDLLESGTLPTPVIAGFKSSLEYLNKVGIKNIYQHKCMLTNYFYERLDEVDSAVKYVDHTRGTFVGTVCFNMQGVNSETVGGYLNDCGICVRSGVHCAPLFHKKIGTEDIGAVRVSFGAFNTVSEIDFLVNKLKKFKK